MSTKIDYHQEQDDRFRKWFGFRPAGAQPCPLVAAGRRCRGWKGHDRCLCQRHRHRLLDHARLWLDKAGDHVYTAEPYDARGDDIVALVADLQAEGLEAHLYGRSPWNPEGTFLIIIKAAAP